MALEPVFGGGGAFDLGVGAGGGVEYLVAAANPVDLNAGEAGEGRAVDVVLQIERAQALAVDGALAADGAGWIVSCLRLAPVRGGLGADLRVDLLRGLRLRGLGRRGVDDGESEGGEGEEEDQAGGTHEWVSF